MKPSSEIPLCFPKATSVTPQEIADIDQDDFTKAMLGEDALSVVIKGTIFLENQLIQFIEENAHNPAAAKEMRLDYAGRVSLALVLGFPEQYASPLRSVGNIRNKFAHRLEAAMTKTEADSLYGTFRSDDRHAVQMIYQRTKKQLKGKRPARFNSLTPIERFTILVTTLRGAIIVIRSKAKAARRVQEAGGYSTQP